MHCSGPTLATRRFLHNNSSSGLNRVIVNYNTVEMYFVESMSQAGLVLDKDQQISQLNEEP